MGGAVLAGLLTRPLIRRVTAITLAVLAITLFLINLRRAGELYPWAVHG